MNNITYITMHRDRIVAMIYELPEDRPETRTRLETYVDGDHET